MTDKLTFRPGDFVRARSTTWIVEDLVAQGPVPTLDLVSVEDDSQGDGLRVAVKAELDLERIDTSDWSNLLKNTFESPRRLGAHLLTTEWRTATSADRRLFQAPFRSGIRLEQYQLLPLAKALELPRVNLLIADDVGLGKTIEAGLIVRELLLRRRLSFVVVAAPASMQSQWQDELSQKFGLDFTIVDRDYLLESRRRRGFTANPWSIGSRFIVSHSVLADETYMNGLRDILQSYKARSMFILDEAHHAAPAGGLAWATESQLTRAVREIAQPFEHRLFLSATPHNGHANSFSTLLDILDPQRFTRGIEVNAKDLEPVMVRRLKEDLRQLGHKFPERLVAPIVIDGLPPEAPELQLAAMLDAYRSGNLGGSRARFLFANLQQRLFSSVTAFDRTLRTHLRALQRRHEKLSGADDTAEDVVESDDLIEVVTHDARGELGDINAAIGHVEAMLKISEVHRHASDQRIERLLDWIEAEMLDEEHAWKDRRLILFTEWDDTRRWVVERLEEGLSERSRGRIDLNGRVVSFTGRTSLDERDTIKERFNAPFDKAPIRILVCTDAAREGLNLQTRCRDLIHIDLPWNPSRLEQRNGRIDRKLQPSRTVSCRYFLYRQRVEDRVLDTLIRKTEIIRKQLGTAGEVLRRKIETRLTEGGISRRDADSIANEIENVADDGVGVAKRDLDDEADRRIRRLKEEQDWLQRRLEEARLRVGVAGADVKRIVEIALTDDGARLEPGHFAVPEAVAIDTESPAFEKDPTWAVLFDELRAGRPPRQRDRAKWRRETPVRGLVFDPPVLTDGEPEPQDIVQLHLEHRLVKRLISRFASQGFRSSIGRVTAIVGAGAQPRVALIGRLSLFGPDARRLHEEIITVTAAWRDVRREVPLEPFGDTGEATTIAQLEEALRTGRPPGDGIIERLRQTVDADIADLRPHLERRAGSAELAAIKDLTDNGEREASGLRELLERQIRRVRENIRDAEPPAQLSFDLYQSDEQKQQAERELRQFELDRRSWDGKLVRLQQDLDSEPQKVRDNYAVAARQIEPIGLVYLWPTTS
ncbi:MULTISPECIES: DISARM system SNF2-like helicase DrmD [unclassified Mesorhizobium]|uniref:DISARM system SNF2-like helicase DrmD n=1 Tax=unclassified Mesorhizobium TaxID=325217 RepID=UPI001FE182F0|nr:MULTISPECIES: DISARM system SNF2-like helicase DrmD [unclassified Mesorhizobium]